MNAMVTAHTPHQPGSSRLTALPSPVHSPDASRHEHGDPGLVGTDQCARHRRATAEALWGEEEEEEDAVQLPWRTMTSHAPQGQI